MQNKFRVLCALGLGLFILPGCSGGGKNPASLGNKNNALFQSADAGIKAHWDTAMEAIRTNGYATAIISLQEISQGTNTAVTPEQIKAVNETVTAVSDSMYAAANKGDANARAAIEELRKGMAR